MTGRVFSQLQTPNTVRAILGAKIRRLIEEVASLNLNRDSTLLLSVGGNDVFPKNCRHGPTEAIVRDLDHLLETAKSKVNRCVVVGILPRKYRTNEAYSRALGVNRRLAALCNKYSFRFVDLWTAFYGRDVLFQRDGVHLSARGARTLDELLNSRLFKPVKELRGVQADKPVPVDRLNNKNPHRNRNRKRRKQQPEKTTTRSDASVPPPVAGSGSPNPPTGPGKRQRSPQTGGTPSPTQGPSQRRRCVSLDGGQRNERPHHSLSRSPSPPGNGSPSDRAITLH